MMKTNRTHSKSPSALAIAVAVTTALAAALAGCQSLMPGILSGSHAESRTSAGAIQPSGFGNLRLTVKWPMSTGYRAQLIPDSTARLDIAVMQGVTTVGTASVARPSGQSITTTSVRVPADTGLDATVEAYSAASGGTLVASGSQSNLDVAQSQDTDVAITLTPAFAPTISGLTPSSGDVGVSVVIAGSNFASAWTSQDPTVMFGAVEATITASSDTEITVTVPVGAVDGEVTVSNDGMTSAGSAFNVTPD